MSGADERAIDMLGWSFLSGHDIGSPDDPYMDRLCIVRTPFASLYLHHIHREDTDPDPHDHPWAFASLVLCGWYQETVWPDKRVHLRTTVRRRGQFSLRRLDRDAAHKITAISGPLWTLVLTGPRRGDWGFWVNGRFAPWREYLGAHGKGESGEVLPGSE